jgi:hypothetical protein
LAALAAGAFSTLKANRRSEKGFAVPEFQQFEEFLQVRETFAFVDQS